MKIKQHINEIIEHWINVLRKPVTSTYIIAVGSAVFAVGGIIAIEQHYKICAGALLIQGIRHCIDILMQKSN